MSNLTFDSGRGARGSAPSILFRLFAVGLLFGTGALSPVVLAGDAQSDRSTWPQDYTAKRDARAGTLTLHTAYYEVEHDLKRGGVIRRITLTHGRATNLLVRPLETQIVDEAGGLLTDVGDTAPEVTHHRADLRHVVSVAANLVNDQHRPSGVRLNTTYEYGWGYVKIHREYMLPGGGLRAREVCALTTVLAPTLTDYGYREGITEQEGGAAFPFGSNRWGKQPPDPSLTSTLRTSFVPRSMIFVDPGVEGLEWFVGSNLSAWDLQFTGRRGDGLCLFGRSRIADGLSLTLSPLALTNQAVTLSNRFALDFYLAVPLLEGHALAPWVHTSFNRNRGQWVSAEELQRMAAQGYQTVHCHNDGDYYDDGLFWRDGSYPPYPDMPRYDRVLAECRRLGLRTATYFSNKELHPSTPEFQAHGREWGRMNRKGELQHNFLKPKSEFGVQMCLRSGWLDFLKHSIDRVLKNHALDGVYYDWNVALLCQNPQHEGKSTNAVADGHWDMDELLDLMEWTRQRVGPRGLVIVHNTTTPMFALENFSDHVVATEWGYGKWTDRAPGLNDLPLEWTLAGARSRGVISYGTIDEKAPRRLHRLFALQAMLGGVTPWPASPEALELLPLLQPLGRIEAFQFVDWRNQAVTLSDSRCAAAVYSRVGEAYLLLANLEAEAKEVLCTLKPDKLPHPLRQVSSAIRFALAQPDSGARTNALSSASLAARDLIVPGLKVGLPGDGAVLLRVRQ